MYEQIAAHPTVRALLAQQLQQEDTITAADAEAMVVQVTERLQAARREAEANPSQAEPPAPAPPGLARRTKTEVPAEQLHMLNAALQSRPQGFSMNPRLERTLERRTSGLEL